MGWTHPKTQEPGTAIVAADWNTHVRDNLQEVWREFVYVEFTAAVTVSATAEATPNDVVSAGALTHQVVPHMIEFFAPSVDAPPNNGANLYLNLWDDTTNLGRLYIQRGQFNEPSSGVYACRRLTPTAGSHTYKIRGFRDVANFIVEAGAGGADVLLPGYIRILAKGSTS